MSFHGFSIRALVSFSVIVLGFKPMLLVALTLFIGLLKGLVCYVLKYVFCVAFRLPAVRVLCVV